MTLPPRFESNAEAQQYFEHWHAINQERRRTQRTNRLRFALLLAGAALGAYWGWLDWLLP
jgi:hypothetical protein